MTLKVQILQSLRRLIIISSGKWHDLVKKCLFPTRIHETVNQNLWLMNGRFLTLSNHFFANYMNLFHKKTEVQTVILRCWMGLNLSWFKSHDTKRKCFTLLVFFLFCYNCVMFPIICIFAFLKLCNNFWTQIEL